MLGVEHAQSLQNLPGTLPKLILYASKCYADINTVAVILTPLRARLTLPQDVDEVGHGVVVYAVQGIEGVDEEVGDGSTCGHRPVHLPGLADGHLGLLSQFHLFRNVGRRPLCLFQVFYELNVLKNVSLHSNQPPGHVPLVHLQSGLVCRDCINAQVSGRLGMPKSLSTRSKAIGIKASRLPPANGLGLLQGINHDLPMADINSWTDAAGQG